MRPAQSALKKPSTSIEVDFLIYSPRSTVPRTYRSILFTALQWTVVGAWRNWHTLFTAKDKSGRVSMRYWRAPTTLWYLEESSFPSLVPLVMLSFSVVESGISTGLALSMPDLTRRLVAYRACVSTSPSDVFLTSMPRKKCRSPRSLSTKSF